MLQVRRLIIVVVMLVWCFAADRSAAQDAIGAVSRIQGEASGTRNGATRPLSLNASIFRNEVVSTGETTRLEVTFTDATRLTLGEKTKLTLDSYVFDPAAARGTIKFCLVGAFRFVSGQASKLASADVSVTTPVAIVGIRGTEFWGGDRRSGAWCIPHRRGRGRVERRRPADSEPARPGHQHCRAWRRARAGHHLAAGQGQPRPGDRYFPIAKLAERPDASSEPKTRPAPAAPAKPLAVGFHRALIHVEVITSRRCTSSVDDRVGARQLRAKKGQSLFLDHPARLASAQLAGHRQHRSRRNDIRNGESELPKVGWRGPAPAEQFEERLAM